MMDRKQVIHSNGSREPKFKVGDQVIRKGKQCTVRFVDHSMDPVSYMIQVNGTDRKIGTEESYLRPVEARQFSSTDNSRVQKEINHESDSGEEDSFGSKRRYSSSQSSEGEEEEHFCLSPRKRRRRNPFFVEPYRLQQDQPSRQDVDYYSRHAEKPRQARAHRRMHEPQPHYRRPATDYVRRPDYAEPRRLKSPFGALPRTFFPVSFKF